MVLVGAEGVVENGGVINKLGTYQIALCCQALNKPFYVAAGGSCMTRGHKGSLCKTQGLPQQDTGAPFLEPSTHACT